jgi:hypothetical protein
MMDEVDVIERARRALANRDELRADLQERQANELGDIPQLPVDRRGLIYKRRENARVVTPQPAPPTVTPTPTENWQIWIEDRIHQSLQEFAGDVGDQLGADRVRISDLEDEIAALKAEIAERRQVKPRAPRKPKQLQGPGNITPMRTNVA